MIAYENSGILQSVRKRINLIKSSNTRINFGSDVQIRV